MGDMYINVPKKLFHISANGNYGGGNLQTATDQVFRRFIGPIGIGAAPSLSGAWFPVLIIARLPSYASLPSAGTIGGIYTGATGGGTAIVNSFAWPTSGSKEIVLPIYSTNFPDPRTGGQTVSLQGTPNLYMNTPSSSSSPVSVWIFGYEPNDVY